MDDSDQEQPKGGARTSFRWNYGGKEGREVFALDTTINGNPTEADLEAHIASVIKAMSSVFRHGGRARQPQAESQAASQLRSLHQFNQVLATGSPDRTGKPILIQVASPCPMKSNAHFTGYNDDAPFKRGSVLYVFTKAVTPFALLG